MGFNNVETESNINEWLSGKPFGEDIGKMEQSMEHEEHTLVPVQPFLNKVNVNLDIFGPPMSNMILRHVDS
jgi:hypothetical protein